MRNVTLYTLLLLLGLTLGATLMGAAHLTLELIWPYEKVVKYGALLVAALIIVLQARRDGLTRGDLGLQTGHAGLQLVVGFGTTVVLLLPLWIFLLGTGAREADFLLLSKSLAYHAGGYLLIGVAVATVEELYFRGVLMSDARRANIQLALIASALLYTVLHFLRPEAGFGEPPWYGGTLMLMEAVQQLPQALLADLPKVATLLAIGLGLGLVRWHTGSLALCIGAHAAMVFSMKMFQEFTDSGHAMMPWVAADSRGGWSSTVWLAILLIFLWQKLPKKS